MEEQGAVVVLGQRAVVGQAILALELQVFAETVVQTHLIVGLLGHSRGRGAIHVVTHLAHEFVGDKGHDGQGIEAVGLVVGDLLTVVVGIGLDGHVLDVLILLIGGGEAAAR